MGRDVRRAARWARSVADRRRRARDGVAGAGARVEAASQVAPAATRPRRGSRRPDDARSRGRSDVDRRWSRRRRASTPHRASVFTKDTADADPLETDFSEIGANGAPSALGDFLGAPPRRAERPSTADGYDGRSAPTRARITARGGTPVPDRRRRRAHVGVAPARDARLASTMTTTMTSRSTRRFRRRRSRCRSRFRRRRRAPHRSRDHSPRDAGGRAARQLRAACRTGRDEADSPFSENTRVADVGEMQSHARDDARSKAPTAPPPFAFPINDRDATDRRGRLRRHRDRRRRVPTDATSRDAIPRRSRTRRTAAHVFAADASTETRTRPIAEPADSVTRRRPEPADEDDLEVADGAVASPAARTTSRDVARRGRRRRARSTSSRSVPRRTPPAGLDAALDDIRPRRARRSRRDAQHVGGRRDVGAHRLDEPPRSTPREAASPGATTDDDDDDIDFGEGLDGRRRPTAAVQRRVAAIRRARCTASARSAPTERPSRSRAVRPRSPTCIAPRAESIADRTAGASERRRDAISSRRSTASPRRAAGRKHARLRRRCRSATRRPRSSRRSISKRSSSPEQVEPLPSSELDEDAAARARDLRARDRDRRRERGLGRAAHRGRPAVRAARRSDRARAHYDAALLADPRATPALRGLRRIARASARSRRSDAPPRRRDRGRGRARAPAARPLPRSTC